MGILASEEEAATLIQQLKELWMKSGMYPRKRLSNYKHVLPEVNREGRAKEIDLVLIWVCWGQGNFTPFIGFPLITQIW